MSLALTPTATVAAAPVALPAPAHTEVAENTLLIPAELEPTTDRPKPTPPKATKPMANAKVAAAKVGAKVLTPSKPTKINPNKSDAKKPAKPKKTPLAADRPTLRAATKPGPAKTTRAPKSV